MSIGHREVVFITGGNSGIGAGLAKAFHERGAKVIIGGRNADALRLLAEAHPGMESIVVDVTDRGSVANCIDFIERQHPDLNMVVNSAGIMRMIDFTDTVQPDEIDLEIDTNLKGSLYITSAVLPLLRRQASARLVMVSSGLGFIPLADAPVYSATKSAIHAFTLALRQQTRGSSVRVIELIPPRVATNLQRGHRASTARTMDLDTFIKQTMRALDSGRDELPIGLAWLLQFGSRIAPVHFMRMVNAAR